MSARRVLVADDELHMVRVVRLFLERAGYTVDVARNGQEALDSIMHTPPDVLLTDINMPHMNGQQLCAQLEKLLPGRTFPIFVMTSMTERENRDWAHNLPNSSLLEKPVSMRMLIAELGRRFAREPENLAHAGG
ncbi:MAG: response regulator [Candidatus Parcubacteria bacterium]|nr:response regulator [Burkholderiales bacterium]